MVLNFEASVSWGVTPRSLADKYRCFKETDASISMVEEITRYLLSHLHSSAMKVPASDSSRTFIRTYHITREGRRQIC
jgi:hypothetical protein